MSEMRVRTTASGHEQYGAWREGQHDDLVLAIALACWWAGKQYPWPAKGKDAYVQAPEWMWGDLGASGPRRTFYCETPEVRLRRCGNCLGAFCNPLAERN
jgi:hypothetical protein